MSRADGDARGLDVVENLTKMWRVLRHAEGAEDDGEPVRIADGVHWNILRSSAQCLCACGADT